MSIELRPARPVAARPPILDEAQEAVAARPWTGRNQLVVGAPGSGKTTVALEAYLRRAAGEDPVGEPTHFLLAPTRLAAGRLRDQASRRLAVGGSSRRSPAVMTPTAFAFQIVRWFAVAEGEPVPTLVTGAQQDRLLSELLEGHAAGGGVPIAWPPGLPTEVLGIPAFRDELRNLFMRADEFEIEPEELGDLGARVGRPEWVMAAGLLEEYRRVVALGNTPEDRGERYDAARVLGEAATLVEGWEDFTGAPVPRIASVVVDDYQEASVGLVRLLDALRERGAHLLLLADPDVAVQTFRGARPQFVGRAGGEHGLGGFSAERVVLPTAYRGSPALRALVEEVVARVPSAGVVEHRRAALQPEVDAAARAADRRTGTGGPVVGGIAVGGAAVGGAAVGGAAVAVAQADSTGGEVAVIAHELRNAHLHGGLAWEDMAVVVRSSGMQRELERSLRSFHIPVTRSETAVVLRDEPAVRMLLTAIEAGRDGLDAERAAELLLGDVGRLDDVGMRRLRRAVRTRLRAGEFDPEASVEDALVELLSSRPGAESLRADLGEAATRVFEVVRAARDGLTGPDDSPQQVLWRVWDATGLAERWRARALAGGPLGERADTDLDAVMALFELAENYELRVTGSPAGEFVDYVRSELLPSDTLADRGVRGPGVDVLTVAQAAGNQWDLVVVAGVQEGSWPDLRVRDSVLGAGVLTDQLLGTLGLGSPDAGSGATRSRAAREQVLADEWRLFAAAVSRARQRVLVTAAESHDQRPSVFFDRVAELAGEVRRGSEAAARRLDLRGFVAELRARVEGDADTGDDGADAGVRGADGPGGSDRPGVAADLLAVLAELGVPGASPADWAGLAPPSSDAPLYAPGQLVWISPSRLETATTCALRWALETVGGRSSGRIAQNVGNLIHEIAQEHPHGPREVLHAELESRFDSLGLAEGWIRDTQWERAKSMVDRLATYMEGVPGRVDTEVLIRQQVGDAVIFGSVDRLEWVDEGVRVADLKTGSSIPTVPEGAANAQLAAYQLALQEGATIGEDEEGAAPVGARLVFVADGSPGAKLRNQAALPEGGAWARDLLDQAVEVMRGTEFAAQPNPMCRHCPLQRACPAQDLGRRSSR